MEITVCFVSKYDGRKFLSENYTSEEFQNIEKITREKLEKKGYNVDKYDEMHKQLTQEYLTKYPKIKNIFERSDLYDKYEQKKKDLAKDFFNIELENVVMY